MIEAIITGFTLGILLAISIGPVIFAIIKQSLNNGHKAGLVFVAGVSFSDVLLVTICNLVSTFIEKALTHQKAIGISGSVFLFVLGIYTLFFKKVSVDENGGLQEKTFNTKQYLGIFLAGFFMNILNPGVFIFWLAATLKVQSQIIGELHPVRYLFTVYIVCLGFVLLTDIAKVILANKIRPKLTLHNLQLVNNISGVILLVFAVSLAWGAFNLSLKH